MILLRLTLFIAAILMLGCDSTPKTPGTSRQGDYPPVIKDSADAHAKAEREWRRMLDVYKVEQTTPDFYPMTHRLHSLGKAGSINIAPAGGEAGAENLTPREMMKLFIDRWRDLIGADPATISLASVKEEAGAQRLTYRQSSYPFPVAGDFGEMTAVVSGDGRLVALVDRFIPLVELPLRPSIDRDEAAKRVAGRSFTYTDIAGRSERIEVPPAEVAVKQLVVLPIEKGDAIEVHLAWEVVAGKSLSWTVYIDAIGGEELKVVQNFKT